MFKKIVAKILVGVMTFATMLTPLSTYGVVAPIVGAAKTDGYKVIIGDVRVETLSDTLARIEVKGPKGFEDRASYHVVNREFDFVTPEVKTENGVTTVKTPSYSVIVPENAKSLTGIKIVDKSGQIIWNYTSLPAGNQYLPDPGDTQNAWAIADTPRIIPAKWGYAPMPEGTTENADINGWDDDNQAPDMYIFLPKKNYKTLMKDYITLTGPAEMIPLKTFGLWHSRYENYTQARAQELIDVYREDLDYPLDNLVVDTDWRVNGSDGYNIDTKQWPDMQGFFDYAHNKHIAITFNDHPEPEKDGSGNKLHALSQKDLLYRNENLKRLMNMGMDTWWFDRNWHTCITPPFKGINKESFGMYIYQDITRQTYGEDRRPLIMGNIDGIDNGAFNRPSDMASHRFSIQWTGDTLMERLDQEIENVGRAGVKMALPYVSSDISGHIGYVGDKLWTRWSEYAALSPFIRYHGSDDHNANDHSPFMRGAEAQKVAKEFIEMRYRLLPMYYSLSHENYETGLPLLRRLDINYPQYQEAQDNSQWLLGNEILFAPAAESDENFTDSTRSVFIPDGKWIDVWNGDEYVGPKTITYTTPLEQAPIFVRAGSITPLAQNMKYIGEKDWSNMALDVYPSTKLEGKNTLYEDDEISCKYKKGEFRTTELSTSFDKTKGETVIKIGKANGDFAGSDKFTKRNWKVRVHMPEGWGNITAATVNGANVLNDITYYEKDADSTPFAIVGGAMDSKLAEITINEKALSEASEIRIKFATPQDEVVPEVSGSPVSTQADVDVVTTDVNLTEEGTTDWARFTVENEAIKKETKKGGAGLVGDIVAGGSVTEDKAAVKYSFTDGTAKATDAGSVNVPSIKRKTMEFDVSVGSVAKEIKIYLGSNRSAGRLTVTDGISFSKQYEISGETETVNKVVNVVASAETTGKLHFTYERTGGFGGIYVAAIAVGEAAPNELVPVDFVATLDGIPDAVNLSDKKYIDWMHFGLGNNNAKINRKAGISPILNKPVFDGNTMEVHDFPVRFSFDDGTPDPSSDGNNNAVALCGSVSIDVPSTKQLREFKLYFGVWNNTNEVTITDDTGNEVTKFDFSATNPANVKCLTVRFRSDRKSTLHVNYKCRQTTNTNGNVSLGGYTLSNVEQSPLDAQITMNDVPENVNLSEGTTDWKAFSTYGVKSVVAKKDIEDSAIGNVSAVSGSLSRGEDYKTAFSWTDGDEELKESDVHSFAFSGDGTKISFNVKKGTNDIDLYTCAWRSKTAIQVEDSKGRVVGNTVLESKDNGSVYGKVNIKVNATEDEKITVTLNPAAAYDGFRGNCGIAAATLKYSAPVEKPTDGDKPVVPGSIVLNNGKSITVTEGKAVAVPVKLNNLTGAVAYASSDNKVATFANGKVTAKGVGTAKLTASVAGKSATIAVTVLPKAVAKWSVSKKGKKVTVKITKPNKTYQTMIQYRKKGAKSFKKLTLTNAKSYAKKLKKGNYEFRVASYVKKSGKVYQSAFSKVKKIKIK
ncbi:MAG: DUF5110 domain-containing protein [Lachnospiraceae bacterium]|nr:DUF5110 domain-containing protein [Lachnospiraceae bacterium]